MRGNLYDGQNTVNTIHEESIINRRQRLGRQIGYIYRRIHTQHSDHLGIILFLRMGYVVGSAGLARGLVIIALANAISVLTSISLSAVATNLKVRGGGDYYLISRTLGMEFGGAIGLVLFLAQSVSIAFYCIGLPRRWPPFSTNLPAASVQLIAVGAVAFFSFSHGRGRTGPPGFNLSSWPCWWPHCCFFFIGGHPQLGFGTAGGQLGNACKRRALSGFSLPYFFLPSPVSPRG
jgi:hypothetical protein